MNAQELKKLLLSDSLIISLLVIFILWPAILNAQNKQVLTPSSAEQPRYITSYGPVIANEALWGIAEKLRRDNDSIAQMALGLFKLNPDAFSHYNMNGLLVGSILKIPDNDDTGQISKQEALSIVKQHWQQWLNIKTELPKAMQTHVMAETLSAVQSVRGQTIIKLSDSDIQQQTITLPNDAVLFSQMPHDRTIAKIEESASTPSFEFIEKLKKTSFFEYLIEIDWRSVEPVTQFFKEFVTFDYQTYGFSSMTNWLKETLLKSPMLILLIGFVIFVCLVLIFRKQEKELLLIESQFNDNTNTAQKSATDLVDDSDNVDTADINLSETGNVINAHELDRLIEFSKEHKLLWQESFLNKSLYTRSDTFDELHEQVDIHKFLQTEAKVQPKKRKNLLEAAFDKDMFAHGVGFIQDEVQETHEPQPDFSDNEKEGALDNNLLDSVDEIRFVNDKTHNSKVEAFWSITQSEKMTDDELTNEFSSFKNNDKLDVFIAEFEEIMTNLSIQTPAIEQSPDELENIVQFKLSVHFIKVLSDMMQATHLKKISNTVIEFLEDIIDGKTKMSKDVTRRLLVVVSLYNQYIHFVKSCHSYKV